MNPFESTLVSALREQARETAMNTDLNNGVDILENRLDDVDRSRRRRQVIGGLAAAAAAVAAIAFLALGRPTAAPPVDPGPTTPASVRTWASTDDGSSTTAFGRPLSFALPQVLSDASFVTNETPAWISLAQSYCAGTADDPCADGQDVKLRVIAPVQIYDPAFAPDPSPMPGYEAYVRFIESLNGKHSVQSEHRELVVDGHDVTVLSVVTSGNPDGAIGCDAVGLPRDQCWGYAAVPVDPAYLRLAIIDQGRTPVIMWLEVNASNPDRQRFAAEFDRTLTTVRFAVG